VTVRGPGVSYLIELALIAYEGVARRVTRKHSALAGAVMLFLGFVAVVVLLLFFPEL
jgi:hypothetical protein